MHKGTVEAYEKRGAEWARRRKPLRRSDAQEFASNVSPNALRVDLGCGAGRYIGDIGSPVIGIDASRVMLEQCRAVAPRAMLLQGDLEGLPFKDQSLRGGWANMSYLHLPCSSLPLALADLHRSLTVGAPLDIQVLGGDYEGDALVNDDVGGRFFCGWQIDRLRDVLVGAGFDVQRIEPAGDAVRARARRLLTLPDFVGAGMRLLVVGLNPSVLAAEAGVGFARPSNRFWKAAIAAGLVTRARDPRDAFANHGVGMTDLVKRATVSATGLRPEEYRAGMERIERLVSWLEPRALCMVGLSGWRAAVDRSAEAGVQKEVIAGRPVYVMPSTSGANAHANPLELTAHLREAAALGGS